MDALGVFVSSIYLLQVPAILLVSASLRGMQLVISVLPI